MKRTLISIALIALIACPAAALAASGVVVESKGDVSIAHKGKTATAATVGAELADNITIRTGKDGHVTILLANGQIHRVLPNKTLILTTDEPLAGGTTVVRGISVALHEIARRDDKDTVRAMVKAPPAPFVLTPAHKQRMEDDLKKIDALGLATINGTRLLKAQVYYKYRQYQRALDLLLKIRDSEEHYGKVVTDLIALCREKLGKS